MTKQKKFRKKQMDHIPTFYGAKVVFFSSSSHTLGGFTGPYPIIQSEKNLLFSVLF